MESEDNVFLLSCFSEFALSKKFNGVLGWHLRRPEGRRNEVWKGVYSLTPHFSCIFTYNRHNWGQRGAISALLLAGYHDEQRGLIKELNFLTFTHPKASAEASRYLTDVVGSFNMIFV